jgi:hypothetical protein
MVVLVTPPYCTCALPGRLACLSVLLHWRAYLGAPAMKQWHVQTLWRMCVVVLAHKLCMHNSLQQFQKRAAAARLISRPLVHNCCACMCVQLCAVVGVAGSRPVIHRGCIGCNQLGSAAWIVVLICVCLAKRGAVIVVRHSFARWLVFPEVPQRGPPYSVVVLLYVMTRCNTAWLHNHRTL